MSVPLLGQIQDHWIDIIANCVWPWAHTKDAWVGAQPLGYAVWSAPTQLHCLIFKFWCTSGRFLWAGAIHIRWQSQACTQAPEGTREMEILWREEATFSYLVFLGTVLIQAVSVFLELFKKEPLSAFIKLWDVLISLRTCAFSGVLNHSKSARLQAAMIYFSLFFQG